MKIWLLTIGEPVPIGAGSRDRLHRTGSFARFLASCGHEVVWWTSAFDHFRKEHLAPEDAAIGEPGGLRIQLLRGCGYRRNVSLARFFDHAQVARRFRMLSRSESVPDIIVSALPTVEMCLAAADYGARCGVPTVIDLRDMWPDVMAEVAPAWLRPSARMVLAPLFKQARRACLSATALIGITEDFVDWGLQRGRRSRSELDRAFPFAYSAAVPNGEELRAAERFWDTKGVHANASELVVCYFGNVGLQLDLSHVIESARRLSASGRLVRFVLCGEGERLKEYRRAAIGIPNVLFPGWVNRAGIVSLMRRSSVGLDPLPERHDFLASLNNKAIEYLSAGLPIVSSPKRGVLCNMLEQEGCGVSYVSGDAGSLTECLAHLAAHREELRPMRANALSLFCQKFSADVVYPAMANHLTIIRETFLRDQLSHVEVLHGR
jgi:glycosyltransferase involved in cell wall biosynthesis